ncbi:MAG: hypothetical protein ABSC06_36845 [Rhodopila sp.]
MREETVRLWRSDFERRAWPVTRKSETALRVVAPLLEARGRSDRLASATARAAGEIVLLYGDESEAPVRHQ